MNGSPRMRLDRQDIGHSLWLMGFIVASSALAFWVDESQLYDLGRFQPIVSLTLAWLLNLSKQWIVNNQRPPPKRQ